MNKKKSTPKKIFGASATVSAAPAVGESSKSTKSSSEDKSEKKTLPLWKQRQLEREAEMAAQQKAGDFFFFFFFFFFEKEDFLSMF